MENVFLSSLARGDMHDIRKGAKEAIESLSMHPVMFETEGANEQNSRSALLGRIPDCDVYLLLLGAEYGERGKNGLSPTEEEYEEALAAGLPVLGLVQEAVEHEERQTQFINRVRGPWEDGHFAPAFTNQTDVVTAVVKALSSWRNRAPDAAARDAAAARVRALAERHVNQAGVAILRTIAVPLTRRPLLTAVQLTDSATVDRLIAAARTSGLISQSDGVEPAVTADGISITWTPSRGFDRLQALVATDGSVVAEGTAGAPRGDMTSLGWMVVLHDRLPEVISQALRFTEEVWRALDARRDIDQTYLGAAVDRANGKSYSFQVPQGRVSMGSSMGLPELIVVPDEPLLVRRQDLTSPENATRLQAEIRHRFEVAGAVNNP
jgi:hypothetical protein